MRYKCRRWRSSTAQYLFFLSPFPFSKNIRFHGKIGKIETDLRFQEKENMRRKMKSATQYFFFLLPQKIYNSTGKSARSKQIFDFKRRRICDINVQDENQMQYNIFSSFFPKKYLIPRKNRQDRNRFAISREREYAV